jgi:hypothetical protein
MRARLAVVVIVLSCVFLTTQAGPTSSAFSAVTSNPSSSFASAASFGSCGYTPAAITPVWMTGWENGVTTAAAASGLMNVDWNSAVTISADNTVKRNGNYAMKIVRTSSNTGGRSRSVASSMVVFRIGLRFSTLPTGDLENILGVWSTNGNELNIGYVSATKKLSVGFVGSTQRTSTAALSANTWFLLDVRANYGANPHTADWQLDGVAQTQATKAAASETPAEIWLGPDGTESVAFTAWYDDFMISQTSGDYPLGDGKILGLSPDAMGTSSDPSARLSTEAGAWGSTTWNKLDDVPMTSTTDYIRQTVIDASAYLEATFADTTETCMNAVQGQVAYHASANAVNAAKTSLFDGATERVIFNGDMGSAGILYGAAMAAPASGTWDQTKVNGLKARLGYSSDVTPNPYWDALMVEYNVDL